MVLTIDTSATDLSPWGVGLITCLIWELLTWSVCQVSLHLATHGVWQPIVNRMVPCLDTFHYINTWATNYDGGCDTQLPALHYNNHYTIDKTGIKLRYRSTFATMNLSFENKKTIFMGQLTNNLNFVKIFFFSGESW